MKSSFSFWERESFFKGFDSVIIGGGIVGLNCALARKREHPQERVIVIERSYLGLGGSTRNAGFACFGSPSEILADLDKMKREEVISLIQKRWQGLGRLRSIIGDEALEYQQTGSVELFTTSQQALESKCHQHITDLNDLLEEAIGHRPYSALAKEKLSAEYNFQGFTSGIDNNLEGSIHTGKMFNRLLHLAKQAGVEVIHGMEVQSISIEGSTPSFVIDQQEIECQHLFIATNGFAANLLPSTEVKPARNLVLISTPGAVQWNGTFHMEEGYVYFRNVHDRLLIGGARHLDEHWDQPNQPTIPAVRDYLIAIAEQHLLPTSFNIEMEWTGYLGVADTKTTILKQLAPHSAIGVRMGGMGVAIGSLVGEELAGMVP
ncbi:NAD(P)/FAD-dependent oxidoreductase [Sanyastnella coralliicola]|uniref:NAD(P)/FAD-dependent oxidoreductase n=1 Tax=Sanyastnella coralliicola TaxID=3069118 RepID=UPI0027BB0323|nr:FAD-binding oxidoreductase [Longitalea sp. SCSIO 12813]